jgi:signal peptidase II
MPGLKAQFVFWFIAVGGAALDLWSKAAVFEWLYQQRFYTVIDGFLRIVTAENAGAAFGIASGQRVLLISISSVALVAVLVIFFVSGKRLQLIHIALGLFSAGICGNLYDRIFNDGRVRDFIDIVYWPGKHWPAFNVADAMLCIAVGLMIISNLFATETTEKEHAQRQK